MHKDWLIPKPSGNPADSNPTGTVSFAQAWMTWATAFCGIASAARTDAMETMRVNDIQPLPIEKGHHISEPGYRRMTDVVAPADVSQSFTSIAPFERFRNLMLC
jgi:hypothetical protein